jgi:hypothetical protein
MMTFSMVRCGGCRKVMPTDEMAIVANRLYCYDCHADMLDASGVGDDAVAQAEADQREDDNR